MKKHEVLSVLDRIREMTDTEIEINPDWIRKVALSAYTLIKQKSK
nr:hypothetical protein [Brevibacillus laterosporus]